MNFLRRSSNSLRPSLPLRAVVIVPFVLQILTAVGLVGYFSFRNGQRAVNDLSTQLRAEVGDRIHLYINSFVALPPRINQTSEEVIRQQLSDSKIAQSSRAVYFHANEAAPHSQLYCLW